MTAPPRPSRARWWRLLAVLALTVGVLWLWLRSVDLASMATTLAQARPLAVLGVALATLAGVVARSWRWHELLRPIEPHTARFGRLLRYTLAGYAISFTAPGRAGEVVRPLLIWRRHGVPAGIAFGSAVLERVLDVATLVVFLGAFLAIAPGSDVGSAPAVAALLMAGLVASGIVAAIARRHRVPLVALASRVLARLPRRLAPLEGVLDSLLRSLDAFAVPGAWWRLPATSLVTWGFSLAAMWLGLLAARVETPLHASLLLVPLTALGIALPTPAGVGGYHAAMTAGLVRVFGVEPGAAAAAAIITHAASVLPVIAAGLPLVLAEGVRDEAEKA